VGEREPEKKAGGRQWTARGDGQPLGGGLAPLDLEDGRIARSDPGRGQTTGQMFRNPLGSAQAYFRIQRPHRLANRELEIAVEVLADPPAAIRIDYDSTDHTVAVVPELPGAFKRTPEQTLPPSGKWEHLRFSIADARFCGGVNTADFRVVSSVRTTVDRSPDHERSARRCRRRRGRRTCRLLRYPPAGRRARPSQAP
jgi:hypothetical protein